MRRTYTDLGNRHPEVDEAVNEHWQIAVLFVIRDELKKLNALLHCHNFTGIPHTLTSIKKNTTKRRRKRKVSP